MSKNSFKKQFQNSEYWRKRFEINQKNIFKPTDDYISEIKDIFDSASKEIQRDILIWYQRFAKNNNIDISEAKKWLNKKELSELKWNVFEYIKHGEENGISANWAKELENASARYHISRLEALDFQCRQYIENIYSEYYKKANNLISNTYTESMYHSAFEIAKGTGIGSNSAIIDENKLKKILSKPWSADGKNFSERIWGDYRPKLVNTIHNQLSRGVLTGKSADKIVDEVAKTMKTSRFNAIRLVMTESAYFASLGQRDSFKSLGVEKYQILGTLDGHTCSDCGSLDGQVFNMEIFEISVTAPPFHPFCRCTIIPYFNDEFSKGEERFARDENGNAIYINSDITYEEWKNKFLKSPAKEEQSDIGKKIKNIFSNPSLKRQIKEFEKGLEYVQNQDVKTLLEQSKERVNFVRENNNNKTRFSAKYNTIYLKQDSTKGSIAHELFHEIDSIYQITENGLLKNEIQKDWKSIKNFAEVYNKSVENMLYSKYHNAFNGTKIKEEFRGISDILNGMSKSKIKLGYGHNLEYWKKPLSLEKEVWAQFGRILYENNPDVLDMTDFLFRRTHQETLRILEEMIK